MSLTCISTATARAIKVGRAWRARYRNLSIGNMSSIVNLLLLLAIVTFYNSAALSNDRILLSNNGSILYYNSPAAVDDGVAVFAGWTSGTGEVEIAKVLKGSVVSKQTIHRYETPDDHGAPALALLDNELLAALSHHSSDVFVYTVEKEEMASQLICIIPGRFTYPRFVKTNEALILFVRSEFNDAGNLSAIFVTHHGCSAPKPVLTAIPNEWIYAAPPLFNGTNIWITWSIYSQKTFRHEGVFVTSLSQDLVPNNPVTIRPRRLSGCELIAWSLSSSQGKVSVRYIVFAGRMECCNKGSFISFTSDLDGRVLKATPPQQMPYYPSISDIPPQCRSSATQFMSQSVENSKSFIFSELLSSRHGSKDFDSSVSLCGLD